MMSKKKFWACLAPILCVCGSCASNGAVCDTVSHDTATWQSDASQIKIYANANAVDYYTNKGELYYIRYDECCIKVKNENKVKLYSHCTYVIEYKENER